MTHAWAKHAVLFTFCLAAGEDTLAETCAAAGHCGPSAAKQHPWPSTRGREGHWSTSPYRGPRNLSASLAWTWNHPQGRYRTIINGGPVIDNELNIYLTAVDGIRKFDRQGRHLWTFTPSRGPVCGLPVLSGDALYASSTGQIFSLALQTGKYLWSVDMKREIGLDIHTLGVRHGIVVASTAGTLNMQPPTGNDLVSAFSAVDGQFLWDFRPGAPTWNFLPLFPANDSSFVFQDQVGGVYRVALADGSLLWHTGHKGHLGETWTDGGALLADDVVYAVRTAGPLSKLAPDLPGDISAYRLSDGVMLWRQVVPQPPHSWPVIGRMSDGARPLVMLPVGAQANVPGIMSLPYGWPPSLKVAIHNFSIWLGEWSRLIWRNPEYPTELFAFDAATGDLRWRWRPPPWRRRSFPGDEEGFLERLQVGMQPYCVPNPWGSPTLDATGTVYLSNMNGHVYALRDVNGDDAIDEQTEVDSFHAGSAFSHPGPALAHGVMAVASCDTLYVFDSD